MNTDAAEIRRALSLLCVPGEVYELRSLGSGKGTISGYYDNAGALARDAALCSQKFEPEGIYLTLNPVRRDLLARSCNALCAYAKHTTGDADIICRHWLILDIDPFRPAGICATEGEHYAARERAIELTKFLRERGWPAPLQIDSGNGNYLLYRIDLPNDDSSRDLVRCVLEALAAWFDDERVCIDRTMHNAARIIRVPGTINRKGDNLPERPHRRSKILTAPDSMEVITRELLQKIAALLPEPERPLAGKARARDAFDVARWCADHNVEVARESTWTGGRRWILKHCPFEPAHTGTSVAILQLANGGISFRCLHSSCADKRWRDVRELLEPGWHDRHKAVAEGDRPEIFVNQGQLRDKVGKALDALGKKNDPPLLFCRGGILTRLHDNGDVVELEALDDAALLSELSEAANWYRYSRNNEATDADPPANVAKALRGSRQFPFPLIDAVVRAPFFTRDGLLITTSGYHADARVYVALDNALARQLDAQILPQRPTPEDVTWARALLLDELFFNFPFSDPAGKAHAVALTLLPFVRKMIDGPTPNHAVTAPVRGEGTGKGLLVQAACAAALGEIATIPETNNNEELKKFLLAILIEGAPIALLDNRKHEINSGVLAAALTARQWQDRILGKTKTARPTVLTTWVITGNAIRVSGEIGRRTIWIRLNANRPEPWKRTSFKHELPRWAHEHRAELIRACIILVNNWIALRRPEGKQTLGSYEVWARVIGGILEAGGITGFLAESEKSEDDSNEDARRWNPFVERWWERHAAKGVLPKDLIEFTTELVPETEKSTDRSRLTRLGSLLSKSVDQVFAVENVVDSYLKIVRVDVERDKGGPRRGYALSLVPKTDTEVGDVGGTVDSAEKSAEIKEDSPANLLDPRPAPYNEVGGPQVPNGKGKSGSPPTLPTFEDGLDLYPDGDATDDEERDR
jgi:hypothetical protein